MIPKLTFKDTAKISLVTVRLYRLPPKLTKRRCRKPCLQLLEANITIVASLAKTNVFLMELNVKIN